MHVANSFSSILLSLCQLWQKLCQELYKNKFKFMLGQLSTRVSPKFFSEVLAIRWSLLLCKHGPVYLSYSCISILKNTHILIIQESSDSIFGASSSLFNTSISLLNLQLISNGLVSFQMKVKNIRQQSTVKWDLCRYFPLNNSLCFKSPKNARL